MRISSEVTQKKKKVLLLSQFYYPDAYIASHRAAKLAKYLPYYGWEPLVICLEARIDNSKNFDPDLLTPNVKKTILKAIPDRKRYNQKFYQIKSDIIYAILNPMAIFWRFVSRAMPSYIHRSSSIYYAGAINFLNEYLKNNMVDIIFATTPSAATLAVADSISKKYNIPWIADFRDVFDIRMQVKNERERQHYLRNEPKIVRSSTAITTVSEALKNQLANRHANKEIFVIPNGYDEEDYKNIKPIKNNKFTIIYTGTIYYPDRDPRPLFAALENLLEKKSLEKDLVFVSFYGQSSAILHELLIQYPNIASIVSVSAPVKHAESIALQKGATILLHLAHGDEKGVLTGKLFEYLAAGRPILCIPGDKDEVDKLLEITNSGFACPTQEFVENHIMAWYQEWLATGTVEYKGNHNEISKYSRQSQAAELAGIFDKVLLT